MIGYLKSLDRKGLLAGLLVMALLGGGIVLGSRNLRDFDPLLLTYTFGVLFSAFAVAYRYAVWLQRPPTKLYWRRGWEMLFRRGNPLSNALFMARAGYQNILAQRFIRRRSFLRWLIHFLIAWGTLLAGAVTFPLVFGWLHFDTRADNPEIYQVIFSGLVVFEFPIRSLWRFVLFNLLNLSAVMVTVGVLLSLHRRLRDPGAMSRQQFGNDIAPLLLLLAISVTGLMLTFSMHALHGAGYSVLSLVHAVTVSATLLYIPFGKLFHIFQRPAQLSVLLYRRENDLGPPASCRRCGERFAGTMHREDLKTVLAETGFEFGAHMDLCPRCKRRALGEVQASAMGRLHHETSGPPPPGGSGGESQRPKAYGLRPGRDCG